MSILDLDLRDRHAAYDAWVVHAEEVVAAIRRWHIEKKGHEPPLQWLHHLYWRFLSERDRWHTLRNALEDIEPGSSRPEPARPEPHRPTPPGQAGRITRIPGPFHPRLYSYWSNAWVNLRDGATYVFAARVPQQPTFFRIDADGTLTEMGPLLPFGGETEGWYWDREGFIYLAVGNKLIRANPFTAVRMVVLEGSGPIDQAHSSEDGQVHSATLKNANWQKVGTIVSYRDRMMTFAADGELDESIVTACGEYLIIQENHDNRIITLATNETRILRDNQRAVAHCDVGHGYVVGEADKPDPGACVHLDLRGHLAPRVLFTTTNMGHVSIKADRILHSDGQKLGFVGLDGSYQHLLDHGVNVTNYDTQVRANLSPCGRRATWLGNGTLHVMEL